MQPFCLVPLEGNAVVNCLADLLLGPQIQNCGGYILVTKKFLDLLDIASRLAAEFSGGPTLMPHAALPSLCRMPDHAELKSQAPVILGDPRLQG